MVMLALCTGGLEEKHISSLISEKQMWAEGAKLLGTLLHNSGQTHQSKELSTILEANHKLAASFLPRDIKSLLDKKILTDLENDLPGKIKKFYQDCDQALAYTKMAEFLAEKKSQEYKVRADSYFREFIKGAG
ncbi:MAG: hypothetical protein BGO77_00510 [Caedibacter sp. 37-49]|nr:MAG: hypothetical protein BGO77_00510 [Caedibacter sp. 37-49]